MISIAANEILAKHWLHADYGNAVATLTLLPGLERRDQRMRGQNLPDNLAHGARADTVNDADPAQAGQRRFVKIVIQQRLDLLGPLSPQVKLERDPGLCISFFIRAAPVFTAPADGILFSTLSSLRVILTFPAWTSTSPRSSDTESTVAGTPASLSQTVSPAVMGLLRLPFRLSQPPV
jgi:hypothetical protein